jgi:hypothetical protein
MPEEVNCGSPSCLAKTIEPMITEQNKQQNEFFEKIINNSIKSLNENIARMETTCTNYTTKLEAKHDRELTEVFDRLGATENLVTEVKTKQVGLTKCGVDMSGLEKKITAIEANVFTREERQKILSAVEDIQSKKKFINAVMVVVVSSCCLALLSFGFYIYRTHDTEKRVNQIEQDRIARSEQVDASLKKIQESVDTNLKLIEKK